MLVKAVARLNTDAEGTNLIPGLSTARDKLWIAGEFVERHRRVDGEAQKEAPAHRDQKREPSVQGAAAHAATRSVLHLPAEGVAPENVKGHRRSRRAGRAAEQDAARGRFPGLLRLPSGFARLRGCGDTHQP